MRRLVPAAAALAVVALIGASGSPSHAQAGRRPLVDSLNGLRWGMRKDDVLAVFEREIEAEFRESLANVRGLVEEDRLRQRIRERKRRLRDGWLEFRGQRTGWDVSYLGPEYTHGNHEAMLQIRDPESSTQEFYFFIRGQLWKWYRAFPRASFGGRDFDEVGRALEERYGPAVHRFEPDPETDDLISWLEWEDRTTRLRLIDEARYFGFYCLVFESKVTLGRLAALRRNTIRRNQRRSTERVVDAVTARPGDAPLGRNADVVDRLTGTEDVRFPGAGGRDDADGDPGDRDRR